MSYVDGMIAAVPTANRESYLEHAKIASTVFKEHGALKTVECWGDEIPDGEVTSMPMAVKCKPDETIVLAWIIWPSKEVRNEGMAKVMSDPRMQGHAMPFDGKRMIFGSFNMMFESD